MTHYAAVNLVRNPPPLLEAVFEEHRAQFGPRDLELEVEKQLIEPLQEEFRRRYVTLY